MGPSAAPPGVDAQRLRHLVAASLGIAPDAVEPDVPLARYGLDSLGAIELAACLGDALGCELPEWLDPGGATLGGLGRLLAGEAPAPDEPVLDRLRRDAVLPDAIRPGGERISVATPRTVLLTGATGFVGAHLLAALLRPPEARVTCLVRAAGAAEARARIQRTLERYALPDLAGSGRVEVLPGDVAEPRLGLSPRDWERLAPAAIYHAAALVNWVAPYDTLRAVNVGGTLELLRLACRVAAPVHFVSSLAVCYATGGPPRVAESDDVLARVGDLPLGYAQSKCVAEALVRQAGERGLPVTIVRPGLVAGDRRSGVSNPEDLLSALLKGCIQMGAAPDLDWQVDCVPVDVVADAVARLATTARAGRPRVYHLASPRPRHWRECVLWLNLLGYDVRLVPHPEWLGRLDVEARTPAHALRPLRGFFLARPPGAAGLTLPELYEESRRSRVLTRETGATLARLGVTETPVGPALLDRYVGAHLARGFLPSPRRRPLRPAAGGPAELTPAFFERALGDGPGAAVRVRAAVPVPRGGDHSILGELAAWWGGAAVGLWPYRLELETPAGPCRRDVVVKVKARDEVTIALGERLAHLVDPRLGAQYSRFRERVGLTGTHARELAVYAQTDPRFRRHAPAVLGAVADDARSTWVLVLEDLAGARLLDAVDDAGAWQTGDVETALRGIAEVHAVWYGRERELRAWPWLGPVPSIDTMAAMQPLWAALAEHAAPFFAAWAGAGLPRRHRDLVDTVERWWRPLEALPRTLIHNDFNPRNLVLRGSPERPTLCAYDWELATLGPPQRDLAELLCFTLGPAPRRTDVVRLVEVHRAALAAAAGRAIDAAGWWLGLRLALGDLLVSRLSMYALVNRVRPQRFLPRVLQAWQALDDLIAAAPVRPGRPGREVAG
jgi:thioester reductase-like protein